MALDAGCPESPICEVEFRFESDPLFDVEPIYLGDSVVPLRLDIADIDSLRADSLRFRIFEWICVVLRE